MNEKAAVQGYDISEYSAAVIGCGGLGTNVAVHLAGAGIGKLWLCDFDTVQPRNLNRQFFYTSSDTGKPKCALLAERLAAYAPQTAVMRISCEIRTTADLAFAREADIVILAVDNVETRRLVSAWCETVGKPYVNGGVDGSYGTAYLCVPGETPSLEEAGGLLAPIQKPLSASPVVGVIGALQAQLAVDRFLGFQAAQGVLLCFDGLQIQALPIRNKGDEALD